MVHGQVPEDHFGSFLEKLHPEGTAEESFRQRDSCGGLEGGILTYRTLQAKESDQYFLDF